MALPLHVHETLTMRCDAVSVAERLRAAPTELATAATADAIRTGADLLRGGRFPARALPRVESRLPDGELGSLVVRWSGDEEATGWPAMTLWVLVLPAADGASTLALLSPRHPGYDLSTNRVDKVWRDRLARTAVRSFGTALRRLVEADRCDRAPDPAPALALASAASSQEDRR